MREREVVSQGRKLPRMPDSDKRPSGRRRAIASGRAISPRDSSLSGIFAEIRPIVICVRDSAPTGA